MWVFLPPNNNIGIQNCDKLHIYYTKQISEIPLLLFLTGGCLRYLSATFYSFQGKIHIFSISVLSNNSMLLKGNVTQKITFKNSSVN